MPSLRNQRSGRRAATGVAAALAIVALTACDGEEADAPAPMGSASASAIAIDDGTFVLPPEPAWDPNPLQLPMPPPVTVREDQRVFVVPRDILAKAKPGHALALRAGQVLRVEGDLLVVRVGYGPSFAVHPAYVIVPKPGRFQRGSNVFANHRDRLHHGVVTGLRRDRILVKFTDVGAHLGEQRLDPERVGLLQGGLEPGGSAVYATETQLRHVLLVSRGDEQGEETWLTIGFAGETERIPASRLTPLPEPRFRPRKGDTVRAAWRGSMVVATLRDIESPGLFTVKRARAGAPMLVGPTMIMPARE